MSNVLRLELVVLQLKAQAEVHNRLTLALCSFYYSCAAPIIRLNGKSICIWSATVKNFNSNENEWCRVHRPSEKVEKIASERRNEEML